MLQLVRSHSSRLSCPQWYQVYEREGTFHVKRGGRVLRHFPLVEIEKLYNRKREYNRKQNVRLRNNILKCRDVNGNKEDFFATPQKRFDQIDRFIDDLFTLNAKVIQHENNKKLKRHHAWFKDGIVYCNGKKRELKPFMKNALEQNQRIAIVELYRPKMEAERYILCKWMKISQKALVLLSNTKPDEYAGVLKDIREIFDSKSSLRMDEHFKIANISFTRYEGVTYAIDMGTECHCQPE